MWFLLIIFLTFEHPDVVLKHFQTAEACQMERDRIAFDMAAAYPQEADFRIECQYRK